MSLFGTPDEAKESVVGPAVYTTSLYIGLYTNTGNSLTSSTVLANITEPDDAAESTGYARQQMTGTWAFSDGVVTYSPNIQFTNSGASSWTDDVTGVFVTDQTYLIHFKDLSSATTMTAGKILEVDFSTLLD